MTFVTLSLDLKNAGSVRYDADKMIKENNWRKLGGVDTVWTTKYLTASYSDPAGLKVIIDDISKMLKDCATKLKVERIDYIAQIGNTEVIERKIVRTPSGYLDSTYA